jgi:hypothetical protein
VEINKEIELIELSDYSYRSKSCNPVKYVILNNGCWECISHKRGKGGYIRLRRKGKDTYLHRLVYEMKVGKIPDGLIILHSCDNPGCINIEHLSVGTIQENNQDKMNKSRQAKGEKVGSAKITESDVRAIRCDPRIGKVIGKDYGISSMMVSDIKNKVNWKHVTEGAE